MKSQSVLTPMIKTAVVTKEACRWVNFFQGFWVYLVVDVVFLKCYGGFWADVFRYHPGMQHDKSRTCDYNARERPDHSPPPSDLQTQDGQN